LTSKRHQSGTSIDVQGRISKAGDPEMRRALFEAADVLLTRFKGKDKLKSWGLTLAKRGGHRKATVAVSRKMAVVMHATWRGGAVYVGVSTAREADVAARAAVKNRKLLGAHARGRDALEFCRRSRQTRSSSEQRSSA
jgi:transposase